MDQDLRENFPKIPLNPKYPKGFSYRYLCHHDVINRLF